MERVALHLQTKANSFKNSPHEFDLFARSAFNRYYYATFLLTKEMLVGMNPDWKDVKHAGIPQVLDGAVVDKLRKAGKDATRVEDGQANTLCNQGINAAKGIAELMREGYASRVIADYHPSTRVVLSANNRFMLNNVSINDAHGWPDRTKKLIPTVVRAWRLT